MRYVKIIAVVLCLLLLCGCDYFLDGSYHSMESNRGRQSDFNRDSTEVFTYAQIRDALLEMVGQGVQKRVFYVSGIDSEKIDRFFRIAAESVVENDPIGAYAVESIDFDVGTNVAKPAVSVEISYVHGKTEIMRIKEASGREEIESFIRSALISCDANVVIYTDDYKSMDFTQYVQDYVNDNPRSCMEMPQVSAVLYPERGAKRVIELSFIYQTSRETLRQMQDAVAPIYSSAKLYVSGESEKWNKLTLLYSFLMERFDYKLETSITPPYSLLIHGVGDSKTFAVVYAEMCRSAGVECEAVSGTKAGEAYYWNVIYDEGVYYHIDLLECVELGGFVAHTADEMTGYVWDYSAYGTERQAME